MTGLEELALALAGVVTSVVMGGIKAVSAWARDLPKPMKSVAVMALATGVAMVAQQLGVPVPDGGLPATDPNNWQPVVNGVVVALMAMGSRAAAKAIKEGTGPPSGSS